MAGSWPDLAGRALSAQAFLDYYSSVCPHYLTSGRWRLSLAAQKEVLRFLWLSPGLLPKVRATLWRMLQSALPNADRYDMHLALLNKEFCSVCSGNQRQKSNHIFFECEYAQVIWKILECWIQAKLPMGGICIGSRTALTGLRHNAGVPLVKEQWWAILWSSTLFQLWVGWTASTFGNQQIEDFNAFFSKL